MNYHKPITLRQFLKAGITADDGLSVMETALETCGVPGLDEPVHVFIHPYFHGAEDANDPELRPLPAEGWCAICNEESWVLLRNGDAIASEYNCRGDIGVDMYGRHFHLHTQVQPREHKKDDNDKFWYSYENCGYREHVTVRVCPGNSPDSVDLEEFDSMAVPEEDDMIDSWLNTPKPMPKVMP